jgi:hypothetical protein
MPELWGKPRDAELLEAINEALSDLDGLQHELFGKDRVYTMGDRFAQIDYWGTRGATRKRLAEAEFMLKTGDWRTTLQAAQADYEQGLQGGFSAQWILGQFVVLRSVLAATAEVRLGKPDDRWEEICQSVRAGLHSGNAEEGMWAWTSLADLRLVALREEWPLDRLPKQPVREDLEGMIRVVGGPDLCPALWPTFRQFWRWRFWWRDPAWNKAAADGYKYLYELMLPRLPRSAARITKDTK